MEEKIIEILKKHWTNHVYPWTNQDNAASEITAHVFEFIRWKDFGVHEFYRTSEAGYDGYCNPKEGLILTPEEIYGYWLTNIKTQEK